MFKNFTMLLTTIFLSSCATIVNDANVPIALSFSDGSEGECKAFNKRISIKVKIPSTPMIRRSDDALILDCETEDGRKAFANIPSEIEGAKLIGSVVFFDLGITDAITDKHRIYTPNYVISVEKDKTNKKTTLTKEDKLKELKKLKDDELISEETYKKHEEKILSGED